MAIRTLYLLLTLFSVSLRVHGQPSTPKMIAFYNVENLFEAPSGKEETDTTFTYDKPGWNEERYREKIDHLARVIATLGHKYGIEGPDLLGLAEVENVRVLRDLINHPYLESMNYDIIHYNSPDLRGIDVALLYKREAFISHESQTRPLVLQHKKGYYIKTRDVLVISGYLERVAVHLLVNHWPSRRGGESASSPLRISAARLNRKIMDSLERKYSDPFIISMGDFNDDPDDNSIYHIMGGREASQVREDYHLINPMLEMYKSGYGSLAYRDRWHLFDQILINKTSYDDNGARLHYRTAGIYMPPWLKTSNGRFKGYPLRTYVGQTYTAGYSDHFPVFLIFEWNSLNDSGEPDIIRDSKKDQH